MGDTLSPEVLRAFTSHVQVLEKQALEKQAALPGGRMFGRAASQIGEKAKGFIGNLQEAGKRALSPIEHGLPTGWKAMSSRGPHSEMTEGAVREAVEAVKAPRKGLLGHVPEWLMPRSFGRTGEHAYQHLDKPVSLGGIATGKLEGAAQKELLNKGRARMMAEELSRRGWTGSGELTKYLPVGQKGLTAGFTAAELPGIINAPEATPTGEGAFLERGLGALGGLGGMVAGSGVGFVPGMALYSLGNYGAGRLGRILDRLRSGGSVPQALSAPSPQEAEQQLQTIRQYYG